MNTRALITIVRIAAGVLISVCVHGRELTASWYGLECAGRTMANGQPFRPDALTCASWDYPLWTVLYVTVASTGRQGARSVIVTVTDRGPARRLLATRQLDLSAGAFRRLAPLDAGLVRVRVTVAKTTK